MTPDWVCIAGKDGYFKKINQAVADKLEYTEQELMTLPIATFMHPEDKQQTIHKRMELFKGQALLNFENRYVTKSGKVLWLAWTSIYFPDEEVVFALAKDITERKKVELEIEEKYKKFKNLTSHFKSSIEADRKYLANELHEELAQLASVLKMDIEWIKNHSVELSPASRSRIDHAYTVSQLFIKTIRRLSFFISPNMLETLGLDATLEWYCKEFSLLHDIPCYYETAYNEADLTAEVRTDLFRICQEALLNTLNHAEASETKISIRESGDRIQLLIVDNGKGFDVQKQKGKPGGGLVRMRERAASIGGELLIQSEPGKFTAVRVTIAKAHA